MRGNRHLLDRRYWWVHPADPAFTQYTHTLAAYFSLEAPYYVVSSFKAHSDGRRR